MVPDVDKSPKMMTIKTFSLSATRSVQRLLLWSPLRLCGPTLNLDLLGHTEEVQPPVCPGPCQVPPAWGSAAQASVSPRRGLALTTLTIPWPFPSLGMCRITRSLRSTDAQTTLWASTARLSVAGIQLRGLNACRGFFPVAEAGNPSNGGLPAPPPGEWASVCPRVCWPH